VAELIVDDDPLPDDGDGVVFAVFGALAAVAAPGLVDPGPLDVNRLALFKFRLQQDMGIGFLDVAVEELDPSLVFFLEGKGETGGQAGLPRPALARGDRQPDPAPQGLN